MSPSVIAVAPALMAQCVGLAAGLFAVKSFLDQEAAMAPPSHLNMCPTCNGTRRVPCLCQRWSDGDTGCSTCRGSGRMQCSSCGGSGTGRPLPVQIRARRN